MLDHKTNLFRMDKSVRHRYRVNKIPFQGQFIQFRR